VMVNQKVFDVLADESHKIGTFGTGFTYSGHPVPAAVALETLKIYEEMDLVAHATAVGQFMQKELRRRFAGHELVGEARGVGMVGAIELVADRDAHRNFDAKEKVGARLAKLCETHGVISRPLPGDVLAFSPPIIITEDEVAEMFDRVGEALDELTVQLRREQLAVVK